MRCFLFLLCLLATAAGFSQQHFTFIQGAIVRGDSTRKELALVFTADELGEGLPSILHALKTEKVKGSFFFTGRFYRNQLFQKDIKQILQQGHYLGPHSDQHLLYCDWNKRDSLLVTKDSFERDISQNLASMKAAGITLFRPQLFIPPYEWWNDSIAAWSKANGLTLINFTPDIRTNADYTWPELGASYKSSEWLLDWLNETLTNHPEKFNGALVLIHAGTDERRKDKFYTKLKEMIAAFRQKGFRIRRVDELLKQS